MSENKNVGSLSIGEKLGDFGDLLDSIEQIDDKLKSLWREIYRNAIEDRAAAKLLFDELTSHLGEKDNTDSNHVMHGQTLTRYLERMHRSNEQLLKLADAIEDAKQKSESIDPESMFSQIQNERSA